MIVIYDTLGAYGGSHTLMLRMCQWLRKNKKKVTIICISKANKEIVDSLTQIGVQIFCADLQSSKLAKEIFASLEKIEPIKVICFSWTKYLDVEKTKKIYKFEFDNILYCIHPMTFKKGIGFRNRILRDYSIKAYRKIFLSMVNNQSIVSLDEVNIKESERYLKCILEKKPEIIPLPMFCDELNNRDEIIQKGFLNNVILTAARAEFPYKGYILGLIDDFVSLKKEIPQLKLEIVSAGDDISQLHKKIDTIPYEVRRDIQLNGWMAYNDLKVKMRDCKVFVGMGTTVFDASLQYKPAVVVKYNTFENISDHFSYENPWYMDTDPECTELAIKRIKQVFEWNEDEYYHHCIESFEGIRKIYDIDQCMLRLINCSTLQKSSILSWKECIRHGLNRFVNNIRYRNVRFAEYDDLVKANNKEVNHNDNAK